MKKYFYLFALTFYGEVFAINDLSNNNLSDNTTNHTPFIINKIDIKGVQNVSINELHLLISHSIEKSLTLPEIGQLADRLTTHYHAAGYPLVQVVVPEQSFADGVVRLQVIEGKVESVALDNASRIADATAQGYLAQAVVPGETLHEGKSGRALLLLRDLAGTDNVSYRLESGETEGGTKLVAELGEAPRFSGYVSADNYGGKSTGRVRTRAGLDVNSPFGRGERFSVQAMSSFKGVNYAHLGADVPVGYQGLALGAAVSHTRYDLGGAFRDLDAHGNANAAELSARYPLLRSEMHNVWLNAGAEYRALRDEIGATNTTTRKNLLAGNLGINASFQDKALAGGYTQLALTGRVGDLHIRSADARAIDAQSAKTEGSYYKFNFSAGHTRFFTPQTSLSASVDAQFASKNLDSAEQLSIGGEAGVSAYHGNDVSADHGVIGKLELQHAFNDHLALSAFYHAGWAKLRHSPYTQDKNTLTLHGGGIGLSTRYKQFNLQGKVAWPVSNERFGGGTDPQWWLRARYSF